MTMDFKRSASNRHVTAIEVVAGTFAAVIAPGPLLGRPIVDPLALIPPDLCGCLIAVDPLLPESSLGRDLAYFASLSDEDREALRRELLAEGARDLRR